jgi:hypothetical protein
MSHVPEVHQELSLSEILHLIPGNVVDGHPLVPTGLQAMIDVEQQIHVIIPARAKKV